MYSLEDIKKIIPHRDPMLLIDKILSIVEIDGKKIITGEKKLKEDDNVFKGHFPDLKVMPGVLILEALAQTGATYVLSLEQFIGKVALFAGADKVKFKKMVVPGDTLTLKVRLDKLKSSFGIGEAWAYVNDEIACEATIKFWIK